MEHSIILGSQIWKYCFAADILQKYVKEKSWAFKVIQSGDFKVIKWIEN